MHVAISVIASFVLAATFTQPVYPQQAAQNEQQTPKQSLYALEEQAMHAYDKKDYAESMRLFDVAFSEGLSRSDDAYSAACSSALAGKAGKALDYLNQAARLGFHDPDHMKADTDLASVRPDPRFLSILARVRENDRIYQRAHGDPERAAIVTSDIDLFWSVYDRLQTAPDPAAVIEEQYFRPGSAGLQDFIFARIHSSSDLWDTMKKAPRYYAALRAPSSQIKDFTPRIRASFRKMKDLYPASTFPDVYFLIGRMNSAGTTGDSGLLLGADMFGKGPNVPMDELDEWHRTVVASVTTVPTTVAHELIHYQQRAEGKTLLAAAILEGSADFIGQLISGDAMNENVRDYGMQHEAELWGQFSKEMDGTDTSHWMYEGKAVNGRPADLAYFVGYRITQAYYDKTPDKKKAIGEILAFKDADAFLKESGYADRFKAH